MSSKAEKIISKIEDKKNTILEAEINKLQEKYEEADANHRDTGYDRYWNTMKRCEEDLKALQEYKDRDNAIKEAIEVKDKYTHELNDIVKEIKNRIFYLEAVIPDCSELRSLKMYIEGLR